VGGNNGNLYNTPKNGLRARRIVLAACVPHGAANAGAGMFQGFLECAANWIQSGSPRYQHVPTIDNITFAATLSNPFPNGITNGWGRGGRRPSWGRTYLLQPESSAAARVPVEVVAARDPGVSWLMWTWAAQTYRLEVTRNLNALPINTSAAARSADAATTATSPALCRIRSTACSRQTRRRSSPTRTSPESPHGEVFRIRQLNTTTNEGYAWYHSCNWRPEAVRQDSPLMANYTFSKFMAGHQLLNAGDPAPVREISDQDVPRRFTLSGWPSCLRSG